MFSNKLDTFELLDQANKEEWFRLAIGKVFSIRGRDSSGRSRIVVAEAMVLEVDGGLVKFLRLEDARILFFRVARFGKERSYSLTLPSQ